MADTVTVPQGVDSRTPETPEERRGLHPVYFAPGRLRSRLVDELVDKWDPDPMLCRLIWIAEEASTSGIEEGILLSWIDLPTDQQCPHPPCWCGLIFEGDETPKAECPVCMGTGCLLSPEEFAMIRAEMEAEGRELYGVLHMGLQGMRGSDELPPIRL
jgi:hypothetical protein